jgi:hypothetical protein
MTGAEIQMHQNIFIMAAGEYMSVKDGLNLQIFLWTWEAAPQGQHLTELMSMGIIALKIVDGQPTKNSGIIADLDRLAI